MEIEVVFPQVCGAFYKAFLLEINLADRKAKVGFPTNWRPVAWADLAQIRYPDDSSTGKPFTPGCKVEALLPHHDNEYPGWWTGVLIKSKGELNVVEFQSGSEKYQDIVEQEKLRLPNNSPPLSKVQLLTKDYPVPEDIQDYCQRTAVHENFRAKIRAVCVMYNNTDYTLTVVGADDSCLEKANILIDMHLKDLATQKSLLATTHRMTSSLLARESRSEHSSGGLIEVRFHVPQELVGLAIGREGVNVNAARRLDGIVSIEFDDYTSMFRIKGESMDAVTKARSRLEYTTDTMLVPKGLAGKMIGKKGSVLTDILDKSRVNNIKVVGDEDAQRREVDTSESVAFEFIGRKASIENAKLMMEYHLDHLKDVESILQTRREMGPEGDTPTYYPRPSERRGSGHRGGRGGRQQRTSEGSDPPKQEETAHSDPPKQEDDQSSESDSGPSVEVESDDNRKSAPDPEGDDEGPDRRRQRPPLRGASNRGRGRGGYRRSRRGGARGQGTEEAPKKEDNESPKPQRPTRGRGRGRSNENNGTVASTHSEDPPKSEDKPTTTDSNEPLKET